MNEPARINRPRGGGGRAKGPFERALTEAIDAVAAPAVRDRVLGLALGWGGHTEVPEGADEVGYFVSGPLLRALEHVLGPATASSVFDELTPVVACIARSEVSSIRPSCPLSFEDEDAPSLEFEEPPPRISGPGTDPAPRIMPVVLAASSDPASVSALGLALGGFACVEIVSDAVAMLEGLGRGEASIVIFDCRHPTLRAETLVTLAPELPPNGRVVFWGEAPALERQLERLTAGLPESFVFCGRQANAEDVAAVCRVLLE